MRFAPAIRSFVAVSVGSCLATIACAESLRPCAPAEIGGLRVWDSGYSAVLPIAGDKLRFLWNVRFKNENRTELGAIRVRLVGETQGRRTYVSNPVEIKDFRNISVPAGGSLLPYSKSEFVRSRPFDIPRTMWTTAFQMHLEIVGASTFKAPVDLHDANHLYSKLLVTPEREALAMFKKDPSLLKVRNADNMTTLLIAFATCDLRVIEYVGAHGGDYSIRSKKGSTIMHLAAINSHPGVLGLALEHGGDVNAVTNGGRTPLVKAIVHGMRVGWLWLLTHGAKPNYDPAGQGYTPAHDAIDEGQIQALHDLIDAGVKPTIHDSRGNSWMHFAVANYIMIPEMARLGVGVDDINPKTGVTPLMLALGRGDMNPVIALVKLGANPNLRDRSGKSCYDYAKSSNTLHTDRFFRGILATYGVRR